MDQNTNTILELFNILLNELSLPQNIFGYIATSFLLTFLLGIKLVIFNCILKNLKNCKTSQFEIEDLQLGRCTI